MNKKVKYTLISISTLVVAFLVFKIFTATPETVNNPYVQMSRIDFKENINPTQAKQICKDLRSIKGLTSDSIIVKRNSVVYFSKNTETNSKKVYDQLMSKGNYNATRFIVVADNSNREVCPMDKNGLPYKISKKLIQFFN
ncbi:hypothetical protein SAMN05421847_2089 [Halpernia humi]|uniref:Uncharacterized protein n=1 Tax=Halpernia humi TaxID=493375 RepID=A0A1H5ZLA1_9FLAO|nr:hypothetical protein [Halpernia humi]SEG37288.1 hypothetical protein SAMN05421847_2089 [Halpernia humi]